MYQYLPCDRDAVKHTGTVPLVLHTDRCTSTYPVIETQSNTQVQYLWCYTHRQMYQYLPCDRGNQTYRYSTHRQMYQYLPCDRDKSHTGTVPLMYTVYQYLPWDRDTVKHTGTVPLVLHTQMYHRCKHTGTVPLVLPWYQIDRDAVKHIGTVPLVLHTDRCTNTHPLIETQSNTQVQYLWCYTQTDVPVPTL